MFDIRYGIYLIIFFMPLYLVRFSVFGIPATLLEVMIYILFIFWSFKGRRKSESIEKPSSLFNKEKRLSCGIILLFSGLLVSTAYSSDVRTSLGIVKGWFLDPFLFFLVLVSCIKEKQDIKNVLSIWALSGVAVAIIGLSYLFSGELTFDGRLRAFYLSPNHLAMYVSPAFLILFFILLDRKASRIKHLASSMILLLVSIVLYFTHSYGALLGISAAISYLFGKVIFEDLRTRTDKKSLMAFLVIMLLAGVLVSDKIKQIENSKGRSSFHSRLMIWGASVEIIKESPIIGIGPGTFQEKYLSLADNHREPYLEWAVPEPHNIFLAFYLQSGLLGLIGFIIILLWFFKDNKEMTSLKALMLYFLFHGMIDTTYWKNDLALMFWLVLGLAVVIKGNVFKKNDKIEICKDPK